MPLSLLLIAGRSRFWFGYMNFPFLCRLLREESPAPAFWRNIKSARYRYGFLQGSPFRLDIIALPFGQAWGQANTDPRRPLQGQAQAAPRFLRDAAHFPPASKPQPGGRRFTARRRSLQREAPQAFRPAGETDGEAVEPAPLRGGRAACGAPPGGSAHARGHSPSRSNRISCGLVILRREQYPIRCGSTTVSSSPCRFLSAHK